MTTQQILDLSRAKLLETGSDIITDATLLIYANLAHKDVIKRAFPNSSIEEADVTFTAGVGALPADFGTLYTNAYDVNTNIFPEVSIADFVRLDGVNGIVIEGGEIKVSPDTTNTLTIKYYPTYATLTTSVNPTIDEYLHEPILYGVLTRAFEDLQDAELSQYYENKYEKMITARLENLSNYEEDSQKGGVVFNQIQII